MPKNRRRSHPTRKLCHNRLKTLRTVPARNFQTTPVRSNSPPEFVRRSQRLLEKTTNSIVLPKPHVSDFERDVVRRIRQRVYKAAAAVDLICSGNNMHNNENDAMPDNNRQLDNNNNNKMGNAQELLPRNTWVFRTPEKQRLPRPERPQPTKQVPMGLVRLHTITRRVVGDGCVQEEETVVISPIVDDVAGGDDDDFFKGVSIIKQ